MLTRNEIKKYALAICTPVLERAIRRSSRGELGFKPDQVGYVPTFLENICRPFWGLAPILAGGEEIMLHAAGRSIPAASFLREQLISGLSHGNEASWDRYRDSMPPYVYENQNITELAGLAVGLFFARQPLWDPLSDADKAFIAGELYGMAETAFDHSWPNNHYWFPLLTITVLKRFGFSYARTEEMLENGLDFLDTLYIGGGWYKDGEFGRFDYYEAWSLHLYPLLWSLIADESFHGWAERKKAYVERTNLFLPFYTHWFGSDGAQVPFGRSLSYRFAASALFPVAVLAGCDIHPSLAGRITARNIGFFRSRYHGEESGILEEGYLYHSPGTVEGYTSDGGAYWCCKTFLSLLLAQEHPFWRYDDARLPAETGDWLVVPANREVQLLFEGHQGCVTLYNNSAQYYLNGKLTHHFGNLQAWYGKFVYHSAAGFACSTPDTVSYDSMISLMTPDDTMASHRVGYTQTMWRGGVLHCVHTPFANDPETRIETWIKPCGGYHIRAHIVTLSQPYRVREGGFSLGRWTDDCPTKTDGDTISVANHAYVSVLKVLADTPVTLDREAPQSGTHLYAPLAAYPAWKTGVLSKGTYRFVTAFAVWKRGQEETLPDLGAAAGEVFA